MISLELPAEQSNTNHEFGTMYFLVQVNANWMMALDQAQELRDLDWISKPVFC